MIVLTVLVGSRATGQLLLDLDDDCDVDTLDFVVFEECRLAAPGAGLPGACDRADYNGDHAIDLVDWGALQAMFGSTMDDVYPLFGTPEFPAGDVPNSLAMGDLDEDGETDVVVTSFSEDTVSVLLSCGVAGYSNATQYTAGDTPTSIAIADLDGDGDLDLAITDTGAYVPDCACYINDFVLTRLNDGGGGFTEFLFSYGGDGPQSVALGDLDADGDLDAVVVNPGAYIPGCACYINSRISVLFNRGDGYFASLVAYEVPDGPRSVSIADFDGDGDADVAVVTGLCFSSSKCPIVPRVVLLMNDGSGTLTDPRDFPTDAGSVDIVAGDLDGDGDADLVLANTLADSVTVLVNDGGGFYSDGVQYGTGKFPGAIALGDLDADEDLDVAVRNLWSDDVSLFVNSGDGTFGEEVRVGPGGTPSAAVVGRQLAIHDVDSDGHADLVVANQFSGDSITVILNNTDGSFGDRVIPVGESPQSITTGDFDGDGDTDLATANSVFSGLSNVSVLLNDGAGGFAHTLLNVPTGGGPRSIGSGDLDNDGHTDLVVTHSNGDSVLVMLNNGEGSYAGAVEYAAGAGTWSVAVGDVDGDGDGDLAVANLGEYNFQCMCHVGGNIGVLHNNGDGTFTDPIAYEAGDSPRSVTIDDLDGDSDLDIIVVNSGTFSIPCFCYVNAGVSVLINSGDGTFLDPIPLDAGSRPLDVFTGDLDADGDVDLVVANDPASGDERELVLLRNDGTGQFSGWSTFRTGQGLSAVTIGDIDGNGWSDVLVAHGSLSVLLNDGGGFFDAHLLYGVGVPSSLLTADFDGDGILDVAVANRLGNNVVILLGR